MRQAEKQNHIPQDMNENVLSIAQQQKVLGGTVGEPEPSRTGGEALVESSEPDPTSTAKGEALSD